MLPVPLTYFILLVFCEEYPKRNVKIGQKPIHQVFFFFFDYPFSKGQVNMPHLIVEFI